MDDKSLKLYLIKNDAFDYDTCDGHVVSAYSEGDALEIASTQQYARPFNPTVTLLAENSLYERGIVLESFNAG